MDTGLSIMSTDGPPGRRPSARRGGIYLHLHLPTVIGLAASVRANLQECDIFPKSSPLDLNRWIKFHQVEEYSHPLISGSPTTLVRHRVSEKGHLHSTAAMSAVRTPERHGPP